MSSILRGWARAEHAMVCLGNRSDAYTDFAYTFLIPRILQSYLLGLYWIMRASCARVEITFRIYRRLLCVDVTLDLKSMTCMEKGDTPSVQCTRMAEGKAIGKNLFHCCLVERVWRRLWLMCIAALRYRIGHPACRGALLGFREISTDFNPSCR